MTHCHHAHGHDHDHGHDDHASETLNALSVSVSDLSVSCCAVTGTLSVVSVTGDCVSVPHGDDLQKLHGGVGADQHLPEDKQANSLHSLLQVSCNLLV